MVFHFFGGVSAFLHIFQGQVRAVYYHVGLFFEFRFSGFVQARSVPEVKFSTFPIRRAIDFCDNPDSENLSQGELVIRA
jgi:hypothetical protein